MLFQLRVSSESEFSDDEDLNNALAALNNRRYNGAVDDSGSAAADVGAASESALALVSGPGPALGPGSVSGTEPVVVSEAWPGSSPSAVPLMRAATSDQSSTRRPVFQPAKTAVPKTVADLARLAVEPAAVVFDFGWLDDMHENDEDFDKVSFLHPSFDECQRSPPLVILVISALCCLPS
jgi:hypothetical protein